MAKSVVSFNLWGLRELLYRMKYIDVGVSKACFGAVNQYLSVSEFDIGIRRNFTTKRAVLTS